jgi:hypothetical protein
MVDPMPVLSVKGDKNSREHLQPQGEVRLFIEVVKIKPIVMRPRSANS